MNIHNESLSSVNQIIVGNSKFIYTFDSHHPVHFIMEKSLISHPNNLLLCCCRIQCLLQFERYILFSFVLLSAYLFTVNTVMSTAKRLVLSLRGRKETQTTAGTSSTRLVSATSLSPGHELDEIAVVSGSGDSCHVLSYGSLSQPNGPSYAG